MLSEPLFLSEESPEGRRFVLQASVPAMQILSTGEDCAQWGPMIRLPEGTSLLECGEGFNDSTVRVFANGCFYLLFNQDLNTERKAAAAGASLANAIA